MKTLVLCLCAMLVPAIADAGGYSVSYSVSASGDCGCANCDCVNCDCVSRGRARRNSRRSARAAYAGGSAGMAYGSAGGEFSSYSFRAGCRNCQR